MRFPKLAADAVVADIGDGEVAVTSMESASALILNETAAILLSLCTGDVALDDMVALVAEVHGVSKDDADRDVRAVLAQLEQHGLATDSATGQ